MKRMGIFLFAAAMAITPAAAQKSSSAKFVNDAKKVVADAFRDPDSVRFRDMGIYQKYNSELKYICGEVNAKNGYGAYVGYKSFYATARDATVIMDEENRLDWIYYRENCHKKLTTIQ